MQRLAADVRKANGILLPEWESNFLASFRQSSRPSLWFTEGRRKITDRMWMRFGPDIGLPHPLDTVSATRRIPDADPDGCQYQVRPDGGGAQVPCNEPAEYREPGKLRYCKLHAEAVELAVKRAGKRIALVKFPLLLAALLALAGTPKPVCLASWEQLDEAGRVGCYGVAYDPKKFTCATRRWPCGTRLKVTEIHNGISVVVTVTDKNPKGRFALDLSWAAFGVIAGHELGRAEVNVEVVK